MQPKPRKQPSLCTRSLEPEERVRAETRSFYRAACNEKHLALLSNLMWLLEKHSVAERPFSIPLSPTHTYTHKQKKKKKKQLYCISHFMVPLPHCLDE